MIDGGENEYLLKGRFLPLYAPKNTWTRKIQGPVFSPHTGEGNAIFPTQNATPKQEVEPGKEPVLHRVCLKDKKGLLANVFFLIPSIPPTP